MESYLICEGIGKVANGSRLCPWVLSLWHCGLSLFRISWAQSCSVKDVLVAWKRTKILLAEV